MLALKMDTESTDGPTDKKCNIETASLLKKT